MQAKAEGTKLAAGETSAMGKLSRSPQEVAAIRAKPSSIPPADLDPNELDIATKKPVQKFIAQLAAKLRECEGGLRSMVAITDVECADEGQANQVIRALFGRAGKIEATGDVQLTVCVYVCVCLRLRVKPANLFVTLLCFMFGRCCVWIGFALCCSLSGGPCTHQLQERHGRSLEVSPRCLRSVEAMSGV